MSVEQYFLVGYDLKVRTFFVQVLKTDLVMHFAFQISCSFTKRAIACCNMKTV